jgi:hypothetical protein
MLITTEDTDCLEQRHTVLILLLRSQVTLLLLLLLFRLQRPSHAAHAE